jgi:hypothetical protein
MFIVSPRNTSHVVIPWQKILNEEHRSKYYLVNSVECVFKFGIKIQPFLQLHLAAGGMVVMFAIRSKLVQSTKKPGG